MVGTICETRFLPQVSVLPSSDSVNRKFGPTVKMVCLIWHDCLWLMNVVSRSGTVESRIRQLVMKLEFVESLTLAHPFIKGFDQCFYCLSDEELRSVAQGDISDTIQRRKKEDVEGKEGMSTVYTTTFYIGLAIEPKQREALTLVQ